MSPAHDVTKVVGKPPKPSFQPNPGHTLPPPHIRNQITFPLRASTGTCYSVLLLPSTLGPPGKPCLNLQTGLVQFLLIRKGPEAWSVFHQCTQTCKHACLVAQSCLTLRPHALQPARLLCPWGFSRQGYWSGLQFSPPEIFPAQGPNLRLPHFLNWQVDSLPRYHLRRFYYHQC